MKNKTILLTITLCAFFMTSCAQKLSSAQKEEDIAPTGYWYLGDNGERVWRTLNPDEIQPPQQPVKKKYQSPFGNGRG